MRGAAFCMLPSRACRKRSPVSRLLAAFFAFGGRCGGRGGGDDRGALLDLLFLLPVPDDFRDYVYVQENDDRRYDDLRLRQDALYQWNHFWNAHVNIFGEFACRFDD